MAKSPAPEEATARSGPWTNLALTLPIFVGYHLGVVFLPYRNAADVVTQKLQELAAHSLVLYAALTVAIGFAYVAPLVLLGRGQLIGWSRFAWMGSEGVFYAIVMRVLAGFLALRLFQALVPLGGGVSLMQRAPALSSAVERAAESLDLGSRFSGAVMSLGAGFYEELTFRVLVYGGGVALLLFLFNVTSAVKKFLFRLVWAVLAACIFSGWHYVGALSDAFDLATFSFRAICGLVFTLIYQFRGFAPAVWTHALYDLWVLAF